MKQNSTLSILLKDTIITKDHHVKSNLKVRDQSVNMILGYSKSVRFIKTKAIGDIMILNN